MTQAQRLLAAALFVALVSTGLAMGVAFAHVLELPTKMALDRDTYFLVQQLNRGWLILSVLLGVQLLSILVTAFLSREDSPMLILALVALGALIGAQAVFWLWTFPANVATDDWTLIPENWEQLRAQWEYSQATSAVFQIVAFASLAFAVVMPIWRGEYAD